MKHMLPYIISLAVGVLVGVIYGMLSVRSPAPPLIALAGLLGILVGEQVVPVAKRVMTGEEVHSFLRVHSARHIFGSLPHNDASKDG